MSIPSAPGYRRILVASDFSSWAEAALRQGLWVAEKSACELVVAHVLSDLRKAVHHTSYDARMDLLYGQGELFQRELRRQADHKLQAMIAALGPTKVKVTYETLLGRPFVELIHSVQQEGYDLLLTGTRGLSTVPSLLLGSTAKRLIRKCPCSVWVVKVDHSSPIPSLLVPVDMSDVSRKAFTEACRVARWAGATIHALHVVDSSDIPPGFLEQQPPDALTARWRERIHEMAEQHFDQFLMEATPSDVFVHRHLCWGNPAHEIREYAEQLKTPLIVMGTVGRTGMKGVLMGNTAERVLTTCECSILTVKPPGFASPIEPASWSLHPGPAAPPTGDNE